MLELRSDIQLATEQGFTVVRLVSARVEVAVIPALGAKLFSLRALASGREWLWRPPGPTRLFANRLGDAFTGGTLIGADECLPTIGACTVAGRELPDHGEAWSVPWELDDAALVRGEVTTVLRLARSPLAITRTATLADATLRLDYELRNLSPVRQPFLWALHPLLSLEDGDRLHLPGEVRELRVESARQPDAARGDRWSWPSPGLGVDLHRLALAGDAAYAKVFAGPLGEGTARIANARTGDGLEFRWPADELPYVGVWLTRGGWRGAHHPAIEPTNAPVDTLDAALKEPTPALWVDANAVRRWSVQLTLTQSLPPA